jgi:hypothetical protein
MAEDKKELTPEESAFRNEAFNTIKGLMGENAKLKDAYGRAVRQNKASSRGMSTIKGLKGLKGF